MTAATSAAATASDRARSKRHGLDPRVADFYARSVHDVARDLVGCVVSHGPTAGRIVETESYHESEAACHAFVGRTERTQPLFGPAGTAYVYRSYGIHALLNAVVEEEGVGAAVLIRALEPLAGIEVMQARRGLERVEELCSGPGKLTQALGIGLELNATSLVRGPIAVLPPPAGARPPELAVGPRIGITKAADLEWRFCDAASRHVSRPRPPEMRQQPGSRRQPGARRSPARRLGERSDDRAGPRG